MDRIRNLFPLLGWLGLLGLGIVLFTALGHGSLQAPPITQPSAWGDWAAERDSVVAAIAILRLIVLVLAWYLAGTTTIGLVARLSRAARLVRIADALSVPAVRRMLQGALGLSLAASVAAASSGTAAITGAATGRDLTETSFSAHVQMVPARADSSGQAADRHREPRTATMVPLGDLTVTPESHDDPEPSRLRLPPSLAGLDANGEDVEAENAGPEQQEHEVVAGEHLWSIAVDALIRERGSQPTDAEIAGYWQRLIELNRDRLAEPTNPDLIFPGQRFLLPDHDTGPAA